jgi:GNAT superfamily N-acetyltransferase
VYTDQVNEDPPVLLVPWDGSEVVRVRRCTEEDVAPVGDWLDVHLAGDYFFKRRHLARIIRGPGSEAWAVEVAGELVGFVALYNASRLHNLYLRADWRGRGLGAALVTLFNPTTIRAKTNMLAADPTPFYQRLGYEVVGQDPRRPHILEMARNGQEETVDVRTIAPGSTIAIPAGQNSLPATPPATVPAGQATSPPITPPATKPPPSIGKLTAGQVAAIAAKLRALGDDELAAVAQQAATWQHWKKRQQAARDRRIERERQEAAAAAGKHLDPGLTGEARARVAGARATAAVASMFDPETIDS